MRVPDAADSDFSDSDVCVLEELPPPPKRISRREVLQQTKKSPPPPPSSLPPRGPRLDDFQLVSTIGKGGFGRVFLVRPVGDGAGVLKLDRNGFYALKTIRKNRLKENR